MRNRALKISKITESEFINQKIISVNLHYKEHINIRVVLSGQNADIISSFFHILGSILIFPIEYYNNNCI